MVRYFDDKNNSCITQYLTSTFLGRARAEDLLTHFLEGITGLPLDNITQISMDGPSVNWAFLQKFDEHLTSEGIEKKTGESRLMWFARCQWGFSYRAPGR